MPKGIYNKKKCKNKTHLKFKPNPHQLFVLKYFTKSKYKGLLLYHKLGSGKTCSSILISDKMIKKKQIKNVFIISPGSLRPGWIKEYCKVCGKVPLDYINNYFTFITYNYNVHNQLPKLDFNNSLVVIDEVHNLINGVKNISKNASAIYNKIMRANCRILALSGTPILNGSYEWSLLGNMLKPGAFSEIIRDGKLYKYDWDDTKITNKLLQGIVSFFPGNPSDYPTVYYKKAIKINMTKPQYNKYEKIVSNEEIARLHGPPSQKLKLKNPIKYKNDFIYWIMATKYLLSRKISNFYYPTEISNNRPDKLVNNGGWVNDSILQNRSLLNIMSPKFTALIINILFNFNTKHVVYTFYKTKAGVNLLQTLFKKCGINSSIYSGDLNDKKRILVLNKFNNVDNRNGQNIKVLLITEAGAEGITLLETNNMHILESSTHERKTSQAIGRVVRYKSHSKMPKKRQYVNIWRYWSTITPNPNLSVDEELYIKGQLIMKKIDNFIKRLIKNSIESKESSKANFKKLMAFYKKHNKNKATKKNVRKILKKYKGLEDTLWEKLKKKY